MNKKYVSAEENIDRALWHQKRADKFTAFRMNHSGKLGALVGATRRGWISFLGGSYIAYTDYKDGKEAKTAQKLLGINEPLSNGATEDPKADKVFRFALARGMEVRAARENDYATLATMAVKSYFDDKRDKRMARNRDLAEKYTSLSLGALQINRIKTAAEMTGMLMHISPFSEDRRVKNTALGLLAISTAIGLIGERQYANMVNTEIANLSSLAPHKIYIPENNQSLGRATSYDNLLAA